MFFYGWLMVIAGFLVLMVSWGCQFAFSVFLIPLTEHFGWTRANTAGVFSFNILLFGVGSIFSGKLTERFGPRAVVGVGGALMGGRADPERGDSKPLATLPRLWSDHRPRRKHHLGPLGGHRLAVVHSPQGVGHGDHVFRNQPGDHAPSSPFPVLDYPIGLEDVLHPSGAAHRFIDHRGLVAAQEGSTRKRAQSLFGKSRGDLRKKKFPSPLWRPGRIGVSLKPLGPELFG